MPLSRKVSVIRWSLIVAPFVVVIAAAYFLSPALRDRQLRSELARVGAEFTRLDAGAVTAYYPAAVEPEVVRALASSLETFCAALVSEWGDFFRLKPVPAPLVLEVFESGAQLEQFHSKRYREKFHNLGGFYDARSRLIALPIGPASTTLNTVFHEGTHLVFDLSSSKSIGRFPIWLNEGLATYFAESGPMDGRFQLGGLNVGMAQLVAVAQERGLLTSTEQIIEAGTAEFQGVDNGLYYAAAHTLAAFLLQGEEGVYRDSFGSYFRELLGGGRPSRRLIYFKLGKQPEEIDEGWRRYIERAIRGRSRD